CTAFTFLRVDYESVVSWKTVTDLPRCNPMFHGVPRYDGIIVNVAGDVKLFAKLIFLFCYSFGENQYPLALIQMLDQPLDRNRDIQVDVDLDFYRVRAKPRRSCEFIPIRSIVRGALLYDDPGNAGESLVVDTIDTDMFLRLKELSMERGQS
ncbi:hypothetical protein PHLCEN_2v9125, partial [Hermanssonia centrifuga]